MRLTYQNSQAHDAANMVAKTSGTRTHGLPSFKIPQICAFALVNILHLLFLPFRLSRPLGLILLRSTPEESFSFSP
jgi:hypothetical protein